MASQHIPGELIVVFEHGVFTEEMRRILREHGLSFKTMTEWHVIAEVPHGTEQEHIERLGEIPSVRRIERNRRPAAQTP